METEYFQVPFRVITLGRTQIKNNQIEKPSTKVVFTLYRIVKRSVAESAPDRASAHTRNAAFEAVCAPEQNCPIPLLKVER